MKLFTQHLEHNPLPRDAVDALLLERRLDQSYRAAATQFYEKVFRAAQKKVQYGMESFANQFNQRFQGAMSVDRGDVDTLVADFVFRIAGEPAEDFVVNGDKNGKWITLDLSTAPSALPYPPSMDTPWGSGWLGEARKFEVHLSGRRSAGTRGTYVSGRKVTSGRATVYSYPTVSVFSMKTMRLDTDTHLYTAMKNIIGAKTEAVTSNGIVPKAKIFAELRNWYRQFVSDMRDARLTLVHEYIHFLDDIRYKTATGQPGNVIAGMRASGNKGDTEKRAYYISDAEWNAYYQAGAERVEGAVRDFLIAATNTGAEAQVRAVFPQYDTLKPRERCVKVSEFVLAELDRKVRETLGDSWVLAHLKTHKLDNTGLKGLGLLALVAVTYHAEKTSKFFLEDPHKRMKLLNRVSSLHSDLEGIVGAYRSRMGQGKPPTAREHSRAADEYDPSVNRSVVFDLYKSLYVGTMRGSQWFNPRRQHQ